MRVVGGKSGFKTARDLILFIAGLGIDLYHIATTAAPELSWKLLIFGAGLAGLPIPLNKDESRKE